MIGRRFVVFNADDFGLTDGVCRGIHEAFGSGVVRATTAMVCTSRSRDNLERWASPLAGHIGAHLQLTEGRACLGPGEIPSIVDASGDFPTSPTGVVDVNPAHIRAEWSAQIARLRGWGVAPSHLDSHHHIGLKANVVDAYVGTAAAAGLPARTTSPALSARLRASGVQCVDLSMTSWYDADLNPKGLLRRIEAAFNRIHGYGMLEVMCHPGFADDELTMKSTYVRQRETELRVLTSSKLVRGLDHLDVEVSSMSSMSQLAA
jgi:chitin disaccharide deacetylase